MGNKPAGACDRWNEQELGFAHKWLEEQRKNKNPDVVFFKDYKWAIEDPVQYSVSDNFDITNTIELKNYCQPSEIPKDDPGYMGIIFFIHGFGDNG